MIEVVLVNEDDVSQGVCEKIAAHEAGLLHRAFSVFIFDSPDKAQLLMQKRHEDKYHCGGLWTNTCCSHPFPEEAVLVAAKRRLMEEVGIAVPLLAKGTFIYKAAFDNGLTEHELDHVFVGEYVGMPQAFNPSEIASLAWVDVKTLQAQLLDSPVRYTPWLAQALDLALCA